MEIQEYIESGMLELYVFGSLNERETKTISELEKSNDDIKTEINAIENAILNLSSSFAPNVSVELFEKIRQELFNKRSGKIIELKPNKTSKMSYLGWAASIALLLGVGYFFNESNQSKASLTTLEKEKSGLQKSILDLELKNNTNATALSVLRDNKNTVIALSGQAVAPRAFAKVFWNKEKQTVYIDASGLPDPPKGMVYQVWALKMSPLTPTSVGLLSDFKSNVSKIFAIENNDSAEGFGITLEKAGGSKSPTMEQLYTLGTVI